MFRCPRCDVPLEALRKQGLCIWACGACQGRLATVATLRRALDAAFVYRLWSTARVHAGESPLDCPGCRRKMRSSAAPHGEERLHLDACTGCQCVWFDAGEYEESPAKPAEPKPDDHALSPRARAAAAEFRVRQQHPGDASRDPDEVVLWRGLSGFGSPVATADDEAWSRPWTCWILAALCVLASLGFAALDAGGRDTLLCFLDAWGSSAHTLGAGRGQLATVLVDGAASFCLHASMLLLVVDLAALGTVVPAVEEALGRGRLLVLLFLGAVGGALASLHAPPLGAGAGITAALAWYALEFPRVRLALHPSGARWKRARPAAPTALAVAVLWCALQCGLALVLGEPRLVFACGAGLLAGLAWWGVPRALQLHGLDA